jgi:ABC-2 type transport system ATP-binding protein
VKEMNAINISNLRKSFYGQTDALNNISLSIPRGEIFGFLGPNGSGKTTAINCILSLLNYDKGEIKVFEKSMAPDSYDIKRDIGVIMQDVAVFEELTVYENIDYFCGLYIRDKAARNKLVEDAIEFVGLNDFRKFYPKKLSGGLLRRLNIACGIAHKPKLIILDEPTVAVDPQSRNNILSGIKRLNEEGATVIYTSHYMEEVEQLCSRIVIMDKGKVIASGSKEELKAMIKLGEKISTEVYGLNSQSINKLKHLPNVNSIEYHENILTLRYNKGKNNLINLLDYFRNNDIDFGRMYSELPTLNDVFLEITGKELRD